MTNNNLSLIEAYSPVESAKEEIKEEFTMNLIRAINQLSGELPIILIGDFNAHIRGWLSEETNQNGTNLQHICQAHNLKILQLNEPTYIGAERQSKQQTQYNK